MGGAGLAPPRPPGALSSQGPGRPAPVEYGGYNMLVWFPQSAPSLALNTEGIMQRNGGGVYAGLASLRGEGGTYMDERWSYGQEVGNTY